MRAVILVAGRGSRLRELTSQKPKCLVEFMGKALLERAINSLTAGGCSKFTLVTGYRSEEIEKFVTKKGIDAEILSNGQWASTNMVQSLLKAAHRLKEGPCIISYGDIFFESSLIDAMKSDESDIAIAYDKNGRSLWEERFTNPLDDIENFQMTYSNILTRIGGSVSDITSVEGQYMGILKFTPPGFLLIQEVISKLDSETAQQLDMTSLLSLLIESGGMIHCIENNSFWGEIDSPEDIEFFENRKSAAIN